MNRLSFPSAGTVATRSTPLRAGTVHTYVLNGAQLRDVLVEGRWVTVQVTHISLIRPS